MLSAIQRVQLREPLETLATALRGMPAKTRVENPVPVEILAATVIAGVDNATVAQHLAPNDCTLNTYTNFMDSVRSLVRTSRGWNVSADGEPIDFDAMTTGKGKGQEGVQRVRKKKQPTTSRTETVFYGKNKGHIARRCKKRVDDEKAKPGQHRDNSKSNSTSVKQRVAALKTNATER